MNSFGPKFNQINKYFKQSEFKFSRYYCTNISCAGLFSLSHVVASVSDITPCNKIDKPLEVYRFVRNIMTSIITLQKYDIVVTFSRQKMIFY